MSNKQNENSRLHPQNAPVPEGPLPPIDFAGEKKSDRILGWGFLVSGIALFAFFANFMESETAAIAGFALLAGILSLYCGWKGIYTLYRTGKARKAMKNIAPEPGDYAAFEAERVKGLLQIAEYSFTANYMTNGLKLLPLRRIKHIILYHSDYSGQIQEFSVSVLFDNDFEMEFECGWIDELENLTEAFRLRCPQAEVEYVRPSVTATEFDGYDDEE